MWQNKLHLLATSNHAVDALIVSGYWNQPTCEMLGGKYVNNVCQVK